MPSSSVMHHSSQSAVGLVSSRVTWVCILASSVSSCKGVACSHDAPSPADLLMVMQTLHGQPDLGGDIVVPPVASHQGLYLGMWQTDCKLLCMISMRAGVVVSFKPVKSCHSHDYLLCSSVSHVLFAAHVHLFCLSSSCVVLLS